MNTDAQGIRDEALSFLVDHDAGVLSTVSGGAPRSRLVYYTCDDAFNIFFITLANTRKVADLAGSPHASFVVSELETPRTLQLEGTVADLTETATMNPLLLNFIRTLMEKDGHGIPLEHFDAAAIKLYQFTPAWVRWGDFAYRLGTDNVFTLIDPEIRD